MAMPIRSSLSADSLIADCASWKEFHARAAALPAAQANEAFVKLALLRLKADPIYRNLLDPVGIWLLKDVPAEVRERLDLPVDGIDIVARARGGGFWAVRADFVAGDGTPDFRGISAFNDLSFNRCKGISHALVVHSGENDILGLGGRTGQIGFAGWQDLPVDAWLRVVAAAMGRSISPPAPKKPRPHQEAAVADARHHFSDHARGRLVMPCGTGKSLTGFLIAEALEAETIVVAAPSLSLIRQNLAGWSEEFDARGRSFDCLCVCSDRSVGDRGEGEVTEDLSSLGVEVTTDVDAIAERLRRPRNRPLVVFTTYHSSPLLADASRKVGFGFDVGVMDEAHKTVGLEDRAFATMLDDGRIRIAKRLAMTATERVYRGDRDGVLSMDDEDVYGKCFHQLSFKAAIEQKLICDYKLVTFFVAESEIRDLIQQNASIDLSHEGEKSFTAANALTLASGIALKSVMRDSGVRHAITFHKTIKVADAFRRQQDDLNRFPSLGPSATNLHISGRNSAAERSTIMGEFADAEVSCVSNARCLTEGIDVPRTDCVLFEEARQSAIDIAQAAGRAMRVFPGKEFGYVVVPVVVPDDMTFEEFAATTDFKKVAQTLTAISTLDERLAVEFRQISQGERPKGGGIIDIRGNAPAMIGMEFAKFAEAVRTKIWSAAVSRTNWRPFEEAKAFVQGLRLKNTREWKEFARSDRMPADIPNAVDRVYALAGWNGWGEFLGTGNIADKNKKWRPFEEAREFVRGLGLKGGQDWRDFVKTANKPSDIPSRPDVAYADQGWTSYADWLRGRPRWLPFEEARVYVRELGLADTKDWLAFAKSDRRPGNIPSTPSSVYAGEGWKGMEDWLGIGLSSDLETPFFR